jgi:hypothetical protein
LSEEFQALLTSIGNHHVIALSTEERIEEIADARFIIDHKDFSHLDLQ